MECIIVLLTRRRVQDLMHISFIANAYSSKMPVNNDNRPNNDCVNTNNASVYSLQFMPLQATRFRTGKEQVDHKQFFSLADMSYGLRGHHMRRSWQKTIKIARKFFFSQRVVNGWNGLPAKVVNT